MRPILYLVQKEFHQILRDKAMLRMIIVVPIIQLFIFAYAVTTDLKNVRLAFIDSDRTFESRRLIDAFFTSGYFTSVGMVENPSELMSMFMKGEVDITLNIPKDYAECIARGESAEVGLMVDGQNSSLSGMARGYAEAIIRTEAAKILDEMRLEHPELEMRMHRIVPVSRYYYNPELESRRYMVPGIVVLLITIISGMLTGMAVVKEKELGTLEQLMVTPISPIQFIAGKTIPFIILAFFELTFAASIAIFYFKIPFEGSVWLLVSASLLYLMVTLGMGLLASTISHTQQQAMFAVWFVLIFGILMSGFFYPVENMPRAIYLLTYLNPLRHFMEIIRGIFLKGVTLRDILPQMGMLLGLGTIIFGVAVLKFSKVNK